MTSAINHLKLIFLALFAVLCAGVFVWQFGWVRPQQECEAAGRWWDPGQRVCATPVLISDITGRTIQDKQAEAAARAAIGRPAEPPAR